jgi:hypothetical protein
VTGNNALEYGDKARLISLPEAHRSGSWWRRTWVLESAGSPWPGSLVIPEPPDELGEVAAVVALTKTSEVTIRLTVMTRTEVLPWNVLAYCSVLAIHANKQLEGEMLIDGHKRHPLLGIARLPE